MTIQNICSKFLKDETGATAIEYALIATLIAVALIAGATTLGNKVEDSFDQTANTVDGLID